MVKRIKGWLIFSFSGPKKQSNKRFFLNLKLSLLGALLGIFLLPNLAYLSGIAPEQLIGLTNKERQTAGLSLLNTNELLAQAARLKAEAILETNTFGHTIDDKKFSAWIREAGYDYSYVGENLAIDFLTSEGILEAWNNSPLHKKNLLNPYYQEVGVATLNGKFQGQDTTVVVEIFGSPAIALTTPLKEKLESNYIAPDITPKEINLFNPDLTDAQNLFTNAIINLELASPKNELTFLADNYPSEKANTFIIQTDYQFNAYSFWLLF